MNTLKAFAVHTAIFVVFLFIIATTAVITVVWGVLIRPFLTVYLWTLFMFKGESMSWVGVNKKIYDIEHMLGLWVSPATGANQKN